MKVKKQLKSIFGVVKKKPNSSNSNNVFNVNNNGNVNNNNANNGNGASRAPYDIQGYMVKAI